METDGFMGLLSTPLIINNNEDKEANAAGMRGRRSLGGQSWWPLKDIFLFEQYDTLTGKRNYWVVKKFISND